MLVVVSIFACMRVFFGAEETGEAQMTLDFNGPWLCGMVFPSLVVKASQALKDRKGTLPAGGEPD